MEYKNTIEERENAKIESKNPFEKKESRADLQYYPKVKDLKDVVYTGDLSNKEERYNLVKIIEMYIKK